MAGYSHRGWAPFTENPTHLLAVVSLSAGLRAREGLEDPASTTTTTNNFPPHPAAPPQLQPSLREDSSGASQWRCKQIQAPRTSADAGWLATTLPPHILPTR